MRKGKVIRVPVPEKCKTSAVYLAIKEQSKNIHAADQERSVSTERDIPLKNLVRCPKCKSADVLVVMQQIECCQCGYKWSAE